jgi:PAS domain S-box-containing protein
VATPSTRPSVDLPDRLPEELRVAFRELEARVRGQEALVRSFHEITEAFGEIVYTVDERGAVTSWNGAAEEAFGYAAGDILGRHERILFPGDRVAAREPETLLEQCGEGRVLEALRRRLRRNGTEFAVHGGRSPIRSPDGRVVGATVVLRPMAAVPPATAGAAERTLQTLLDNVPAGIALATADQRLVECNRGFREMLGLGDGSVSGLSCHALLAGIEQPCDDCPSHLVFESGTAAHCRPSFLRPDGRQSFFDLRSFPIRDAEGRITHELKYVRDVTRETERDLELEEKRRMAALGEMAARIAHEVKNPLAGMRGALQVLASRRPAADPEKEILGEVVAHIDRLDHTVQDLLSFSRPSQTHLEATRPDDVVHAALSLVKDAPEMRGIVLAFEPRGAPEIPLDRQQLVQVLTNLIQNAAQALRPGDDRTLLVHAGPSPDGESVEFTVRDHGPGIPAQARVRLFTPFFTTKARGTGLGLAITRKIVEAHGGSVEVETPPDGGTLFRVRIPRKPAARGV